MRGGLYPTLQSRFRTTPRPQGPLDLLFHNLPSPPHAWPLAATHPLCVQAVLSTLQECCSLQERLTDKRGGEEGEGETDGESNIHTYHHM